MPCCEVSKLARGVHSQDVYRVPDGRKYCASMGSRCFPCLLPISWQKLITAKAFSERRVGARPSAEDSARSAHLCEPVRPAIVVTPTPYTIHPTSWSSCQRGAVILRWGGRLWRVGGLLGRLRLGLGHGVVRTLVGGDPMQPLDGAG